MQGQNKISNHQSTIQANITYAIFIKEKCFSSVIEKLRFCKLRTISRGSNRGGTTSSWQPNKNFESIINPPLGS
ncbi:hypothetical protein ACO1LA_14490, partial [Staphylococcus aureus]